MCIRDRHISLTGYVGMKEIDHASYYISKEVQAVSSKMMMDVVDVPLYAFEISKI